MLIAYEVWANEDNIEGKGSDIRLNTFLRREDAELYARKKGPMEMSDGEIKEIYIVEFIKEISEIDRARRKQRALAKLNDTDKQVLGLL